MMRLFWLFLSGIIGVMFALLIWLIPSVLYDIFSFCFKSTVKIMLTKIKQSKFIKTFIEFDEEDIKLDITNFQLKINEIDWEAYCQFKLNIINRNRCKVRIDYINCMLSCKPTNFSYSLLEFKQNITINIDTCYYKKLNMNNTDVFFYNKLTDLECRRIKKYILNNAQNLLIFNVHLHYEIFSGKGLVIRDLEKIYQINMTLID